MRNLPKTKVSDKQRADWPLWLCLALCVLEIAWKLYLVSMQVFDCNPFATIDDNLMFTAARYVYSGRWLGPFGPFTIGKHMFFPLYLALVFLLKIPYLVAGQLLWLAGTVFTVFALSPIFDKRWKKVILFTCLWMLPYTYAQFSLRVYRDNIFPALCMFCFSGVCGYVLRLKERRGLLYAIIGGIGLGCAWLTREDGAWLLPFCVCATLAGLLVTGYRDSEWKSIFKKAVLSVVAMASIALVLIGLFCFQNYRKYESFEISDFANTAFENAVGAWIRCDEEVHPGILVSRKVRLQIYEVSPLSAYVGKQLESGEYFGAYGYGMNQEFKSGGLCWAMKRAGIEAGLYRNAKEENEFWQAVADEVNAACDAGLIQTSRPKMSTTLVPWDNSFLLPTLKETGNSLRVLLRFEQCWPMSDYNDVRDTDAYLWEYALNQQSGYELFYNKETKTYYFTEDQQLVIDAFEANTALYRWLTPIAVICAVVGIAPLVFASKEKKRDLSGVLLFGLICCVILRAGMSSYMEVASFRIGTYLLYLAPAGPEIGIILAFGLCQLVKWIKALVKKSLGKEGEERNNR